MSSNIPKQIEEKINRKLHLIKYHPIEIIKHKIYQYFGDDYQKYDDLDPYVSVEDNFDKLLIPEDHPARSRSDTFYLNDKVVLRTHTTAHQVGFLEKGIKKFLVTGDVYRKDEINYTHYPVFHQMEGCHVLDNVSKEEAIEHLKTMLTGLVSYLFPNSKYRINDDSFPFTDPSFEVEVEYCGKWLEILGCGIIHPKIMNEITGWAFGLGLERLAMILFDIPDIRYFWTDNELFTNQFKSYDIVKFKPYPKIPSIKRDISFWILKDMSDTDFYQCCRDVCLDLIEKIELFDEFSHQGKNSKSYRLYYSTTDMTLTNPAIFNEVVNKLHTELIETVERILPIKLR